jgi:alkylated DNA repair dioxygenase AlkB
MMDAVVETVESVIVTPTSFLKVYPYDMDPRCISEIDSLLLVNPKIQVYGKTCTQHRSVGFFSDESVGYRYSRKLMASQPLGPHLTLLLRYINERFGTPFNGILVNQYIGGGDYISAHSDDEKGIRVNDVIAISWGVSRTFRIREKSSRKIVADVPTKQGTLLHMGGEFQREFTHEIPIQKKVTGIRYSFTFRTHAS